MAAACGWTAAPIMSNARHACHVYLLAVQQTRFGGRRSPGNCTSSKRASSSSSGHPFTPLPHILASPVPGVKALFTCNRQYQYCSEIWRTLLDTAAQTFFIPREEGSQPPEEDHTMHQCPVHQTHTFLLFPGTLTSWKQKLLTQCAQWHEGLLRQEEELVCIRCSYAPRATRPQTCHRWQCATLARVLIRLWWSQVLNESDQCHAGRAKRIATQGYLK